MRSDNKGAIVVEASIALPVYVFVIFTILSIVNICYAQAKMQIALNTAARQFSEFAYVASVTGTAVGYDSSASGKSSELAGKLSGEINDLMSTWGIQNDTLDEMSEMLGNTSVSDILGDATSTLVMKSLVEREFKNAKDGSSEQLMKKLNLEGLNIHASVKDGTLVAGAYYKVKVIELLNINITYDFHSGVITYLWTGSEHSSASPSSGNK